MNLQFHLGETLVKPVMRTGLEKPACVGFSRRARLADFQPAVCLSSANPGRRFACPGLRDCAPLGLWEGMSEAAAF